MDNEKLRKLYGRLKGIREVVTTQDYTSKAVGEDYNNTVVEIGLVIGEDVASFKLECDYYFKSMNGDLLCQSSTISGKLFQIISYLEYGYNLSHSVIEIGSLYNSIKDEELKTRCADILSAPGNFDRVINQSTQVLEDRIRKIARIDGSVVGVTLINKALNTDLKKSILIISENLEEHEGICHICRGLMLSFRNPTHHMLTDRFSREEALKLCAFIDSILQIITKAKLNKVIQ